MARNGDPAIGLARLLTEQDLPGGRHARVQARRLIEAHLGADVPVPGMADYMQASRILRGEGMNAEAVLFGVMARLQPDLDAAAARWGERYGGPVPPDGGGEFHSGNWTYVMDAARRGIDGMQYQAGLR